MSRGSKNKEITETRADESESTSLSSEEDVSDMSEDGAREETPDLYRNSALGMYGGVSTRPTTAQQNASLMLIFRKWTTGNFQVAKIWTKMRMKGM
jgi:hypothetical protein